MEQITHHPENTTPPPIDTLSSDECWVLLESESFGRLAVAAAGEIEIFPVNYAAYDRALYIRTAAGTKLAAVTISDRVAFEVDRIAAPAPAALSSRDAPKSWSPPTTSPQPKRPGCAPGLRAPSPAISASVRPR